MLKTALGEGLLYLCPVLEWEAHSTDVTE